MLKIATPAIVLRRQNHMEADRKIVLMTKSHGKVTATAKGVRWGKGKLISLVEPFSHIEAQLHAREDRGLATLTGSSLRNSYPRLRTQLASWVSACYVCELTENLSPELLPTPSVFELLVETLETLEESCSQKIVRLAYTIKFLKEIGYGLAEQLKTWNLSDEEIQLYKTLDGSRIATIASPAPTLGPEKTTRMEKKLKQFLEDYLPKPLLSADFQESLFSS